jgi:GAF domain-containing protein
VESEDRTLVCTVLLMQEGGRSLYTAAAPGMSEAFNRAVDGLSVADGVGSCGTAAFRGQRVVVEDVLDHPNWANHQDLARKAGLRACWSEPIRSSQGRVLGTFAMYRRFPSTPTAAEIDCIEGAANMAAIALEHGDALAELERQARTDYLTGLDNRRSFWAKGETELARTERYGGELSLLMLDVDHFKNINDAHGHKVGEIFDHETDPGEFDNLWHDVPLRAERLKLHLEALAATTSAGPPRSENLRNCRPSRALNSPSTAWKHGTSPTVRNNCAVTGTS